MKGKLIKYNDDGKTLSEQNIEGMITYGEIMDGNEIVLDIELPEKDNAKIHTSIQIPVEEIEAELSLTKFLEFMKETMVKMEYV